MYRVEVIGLGMGPRDLTESARQALEGAAAIAGGPRLLDMFPDHPGERIPLKGGLKPWLEKLDEAARRGGVAVLASGDACYYGVGGLVARHFGPEAARVHPGIGSLPTLFARLGKSWKDVFVASVHGRGLGGLWPHIRTNASLAVFTDPEYSPTAIAREMLKRGLSAWRVMVAENLGAPEERLRRMDLEQAAKTDFSPLNLVFLEREAAPRPMWLGMPEENFQHEAGLITKAEVRVAALAALRLTPGLTMWDLGAGCGSVGLEACLLLGEGRVFAVERQARRVEQIQANRAAFACANLEVVRGELPETLPDLPDPDRVFIGGGGGKLSEIINRAAERLAPGGALVVSAVRLGAVQEALAVLRERQFTIELSQIQASRGASLADDLYLKAANPVWLAAGVKP